MKSYFHILLSGFIFLLHISATAEVVEVIENSHYKYITYFENPADAQSSCISEAKRHGYTTNCLRGFDDEKQ